MKLSPSSAQVADQVADRLHSISIHLLRQLREEDLALGLGPAQLSALSVLVFGGARTIGALALAEQVTAPTMTRIVDALAAAGLVRREVDPVDRRSFRIVATKAGLRLMQDGRRRRVRRLGAALSTLSEAELTTVAAAAESLAVMFERAPGPLRRVTAPTRKR